MSGSILNPGGGYDFTTVGVSGRGDYSLGNSGEIDFPSASQTSQQGGWDFTGLANAFGNAAGGIAQIVRSVKGNGRQDGNADDLATYNDRQTGVTPTKYQQPGAVQLPAWLVYVGLGILATVAFRALR